MTGKINAYILSGHPVFRDGLVRGLKRESRIRLIGHGSDPVQAASANKLDMLLTDLSLPVTRESVIISSIKKESPTTKILILGSVEQARDIRKAMTAGADAYISKGLTAKKIASAVQDLFSGNRPSTDTALEAVVWGNKHNSKARTAGPVANISTTEIDVLGMISQGLTNKEIAIKLEVSERTVRRRLTSLYRGLDVKNRAAAIAKMFE